MLLQVMKMIDIDNNGVIEYREFVAASLSLYQVSRGVLPTTRALWHNRLRLIFSELDVDNDGKVSKTELMALLPDKAEVSVAMQVCSCGLAASWHMHAVCVNHMCAMLQAAVLRSEGWSACVCAAVIMRVDVRSGSRANCIAPQDASKRLRLTGAVLCRLQIRITMAKSITRSF